MNQVQGGPATNRWPVASDGLPVVPNPGQVPPLPPGAVQRRPGRSRWRLVLLVLGILFLVASALTIMLLIGSQTGRTGFVLGAVLATLPVPLLIGAFRWLDRYEPEPLRLLVLAFVWGAAVATLVALTVNTVGALVLFAGPDETVNAQAAVFLAPPVEEFAKGALLVVLALRRRLDGVLDGIVFAGLVGVGFAFTENILYYGRAYADEAETGMGLLITVVVFVIRGIVSPFAHPLFTLPIGIALGLGLRFRSRLVKVVLPLGGYGLAMLLHGTWNGLAVRAADEQNPGLLLFGYVAIMVPTFAAAIGLAIWYRRREGRVLRRRLPPFAEASWIAPHEVAVLSSLRLRRLGIDLAKFVGGKEAVRRTQAYQRHVIGLGFLRERLSSGHHVAQGLAQQEQMLAELPGLRSRAVVPPPPPPPGWQPARMGFAAPGPYPAPPAPYPYPGAYRHAAPMPPSAQPAARPYGQAPVYERPPPYAPPGAAPTPYPPELPEPERRGPQ